MFYKWLSVLDFETAFPEILQSYLDEKERKKKKPRAKKDKENKVSSGNTFYVHVQQNVLNLYLLLFSKAG